MTDEPDEELPTLPENDQPLQAAVKALQAAIAAVRRAAGPPEQ